MNAYDIDKNTLINIVGIVLIKLFLDFIYVFYISKVYRYMGFTLEFNLFKYFLGCMLFLASLFFLYRLKSHNIFLILLIVYIILIIPTITLFAFSNQSYLAFLTIMFSYILFLNLITIKNVNIIKIEYGSYIAIVVSFLVVVMVVWHYIHVVGLNNLTFDFNNVYKLRRSEIGILSNVGMFGYLNSWSTKIFNIVLISFFLMKKRYSLSLLFVSIQVLIYGLSGHKEVLFSLLLLFMLYMFYKINNKITVTIYAILAGLICLYIYSIYSPNNMLSSILIRRVFFIPSDLNFVYIDFFSENENILWTNGIFKTLGSYPYSKDPVFVIGTYLGHPNMAANTGIFGSAFMQFGIIGVVLYIFILASYINIIQQFSNIPQWFLNSVFMMPIFTMFISSDLLTSLLTHGGIIAIIMMFFLNNNQIGEQK